MSIQSFIEKRRQKKELAKALKTGKALSEAGVTSTTQRTTTGSYVTDTGTVDINKGGKIITKTSGGGRRGSSNILIPTSLATVNQVNVRQENPLTQTSNRNVQSQADLRKNERQQNRDLRKENRNKPYEDLQRNQGTQQNYGVKTYEEVKRQNELNKNILTADTGYVTKTSSNTNTGINNIEKISNENEKVVKNLDEIDRQLEQFKPFIEEVNGESVFVGGEKEYKAYLDYSDERNKEYNKYLKLQNKYDLETQKLKALGGNIDEQGYIKEPTIGVGAYNKQVPISTFSGLGSKKSFIFLGTVSDVIGSSISHSVGGAVKKGIENVGLNYFGKTLKYKNGEPYMDIIPETKTTYNKQVQGTMSYFGEQGKQPSPYIKTDIILPATTTAQVGDVIGGYGKYAIPYVGAGIFVGDYAKNVEEHGGVVRYFASHPVGATVSTALILSPIGFKVTNYLTKVTGKEVEGGVRYSSRAQDFFGTRIKISNVGKETNLLDKTIRFEKLPSKKYKYEIVRKELIPSESRDFLGKVIKEEPKTLEFGGGQLKVSAEEQIVYDIFGNARTVKQGTKTIVRTPKDILFSGSSFGKVGKLERKQTIEYLKKQGWKELDIKKQLRLRQPEVIEHSFLGKGEPKGNKFEVKGLLSSKPLSIEVKGIKSRMSEGRIKFIKEITNPLEAKGINEDIKLFETIGESKSSYLTKNNYPYSKVSQAGKTREFDYSLTASKEINKNELPNLKGQLVKNKKGVYTLELNAPQFELLGDKSFNIYKDVSLSKTIMSNVRKPQLSKGIVLIERETPKIEEDLGFTILQGGESKSSEQFFKDLYGNENKIASAVLKIEKKISPVKQPSYKPLQILETAEPTPRMVGGQGGVSSIYAGQGTYEYQEPMSAINIQGRMEKAVIDVFTPAENKSINILKTFTKEKEKNVQEINLGFKDLVKDIQKENLVFKEEQKQQLKQAQQLKQQLIQKQQLKQALNTKLIKTPSKFEFKFKLPELNKPTTLKQKVEDLFGDFKVFVTKKGKEVQLEESFTNLGSARDVLKKELISTLRAGGGIISKGKKLSFEEIGLFGEEFRRSKINPYKVIQVKNRRFGSGGETKEAQFFRKAKGGNKFL
jgi:hypothetical protein